MISIDQYRPSFDINGIHKNFLQNKSLPITLQPQCSGPIFDAIHPALKSSFAEKSGFRAFPSASALVKAEHLLSEGQSAPQGLNAVSMGIVGHGIVHVAARPIAGKAGHYEVQTPDSGWRPLSRFLVHGKPVYTLGGLQGGGSKFGMSADEIRAEFKQHALTVPSCATNMKDMLVRFEGELSQEIHDAFKADGGINPRKIDQINSVLLMQEVCEKHGSPGQTVFYPFGGTDTLHPVLLGKPEIVVMTSGEPGWGALHNLMTHPFKPEAILGTYGGGNAGNFDTTHALQGRDEGVDTGDSLGHLALQRAIVAAKLNGNDVVDVNIALFSFNWNGEISFHDVDKDNINGDIAFWITTERNGEKANTLFLRSHVMLASDSSDTSEWPDAQKIYQLHQFLSTVCPDDQLLMIQKAIPDEMFNVSDVKKLLAPPARLVKSVICDQMMGVKHETANRSAPVCVEGAELAEKLDLKPFGTDFGYGNMYIYARHASLEKVDTSKLHRLDSLSESDLAKYQTDKAARLSERPTQGRLHSVRVTSTHKISFDPRDVELNLQQIVEKFGVDPRDMTRREREQFALKFQEAYAVDPRSCEALGLFREEL